MRHDQLIRQFDSIGVRLKIHSINSQRVRFGAQDPAAYKFDVRRDRKGEYFDLGVTSKETEFHLLQASPKERHLLLLADDGRRYLCGRDERHWFVAGVGKRVSTVRAAKQALIPNDIWEQVKHLPPGEVDNRNNPVFKRQGEWFFVPVLREIPDRLILKNEPLQRSVRSKPHVCQELYREGGELVYVAGGKILTPDEYQNAKERDPLLDKRGVRTRIRNPRVYVRGSVRHEDHATLRLERWHRVFLNAEFATETVAFLD